MATPTPADLMRLGIAAVQRNDYRTGLKAFDALYSINVCDAYPRGMSYYGLCLARVERKFPAAVAWCKRAIHVEFYDGAHWANLVRVYIAAGSRRKAIEALHQGLKKVPKDPALVRVREEIGYRRNPSLRFLKRRSQINKIYGKGAGAAVRVVHDVRIGESRVGVKRVAAAAGAAVYIMMIVAVFQMIVW